MERRQHFAGIDLHSNNNFVGILDQDGQRTFQRRVKNQLPEVLATLEPYRETLVSVAVESTYNWYWLVDGLMDAGYAVDLVNTTAIQQYSGLKYTDDRSDAFWLAEMKRLGVLPTGYIYPKQQRGVRDLMRKRMRLVQLRTGCILSVQGIQQRERGARMRSYDIKTASPDSIAAMVSDPYVAIALRSTLSVIMTLSGEVDQIERAILAKVKPTAAWERLNTIWGIGQILSTAILLETGPLDRFDSAGDYASYCRMVPAHRISNKKKKGEGNEKNGNRYLCWAFMEAAEYARRHYELARGWYDRKAGRTKPVVARKALAHKLAKAAWYVLRDGVAFDPEMLFSG